MPGGEFWATDAIMPKAYSRKLNVLLLMKGQAKHDLNKY